MKLNHIITSLILVLCLSFMTLADCPTCTHSTGTPADDADVGTIAWDTPTNAQVSNDVYTTATGQNNAFSHYLKATGFGFSIPDCATITGITAEVEIKSDGGASALVYRMSIVKGGVISSEDRKLDAGTSISTTESYKVYGGTSTLWGESWTPADVNASDFGVVLQVRLDAPRDLNNVTVSVDHVRLTVHYTT